MKKLISIPLSLPFFILLLILPFVLLAVVALSGMSAADLTGRALGISPVKALVIYFAILLGSLINIPVYEFKSPGGAQAQSTVPLNGARYKLPAWHGHRTVISVNLGGCIIPVALGAYFATSLPLMPLLLTTMIVMLGVYYFARPVRSVGVIVSGFIPPLLAIGASFIALYIGGYGYLSLGRLAFTSCVFGTLIGADILHLAGIRKAGPESVSVGGAGTFDGILLTGILAVIVAAAVTGV